MAEILSRNDVKQAWKQIDRKLKRVTTDTEIVGELNTSLVPTHMLPLELDDNYTALGALSANNISQLQEQLELDKLNRTTRYDRLQSAMEHPEIDGSLSIYADEATTEDQDGITIHVQHPDQKVQEIVEQCFERIGIEEKAWQIVKNFCGYGDEFYEVAISKTVDSILKIDKLPRKAVERVEENNILKGFKFNNESLDSENQFFTYQINYQSQQEQEEELIYPFRILHFKTNSDKYGVYGQAIIDTIISTIDQLKMMEKAMVVARVTRAAERRIYTIDVGNLQGEKAIKYANQVVANFKNKKKLSFGSETSRTLDLQKDVFGTVEDLVIPKRQGSEGNTITTLEQACLSLETKIDLLDGRSLPLKDIIKEYNEGKENWVYSCDPINGKIEPACISWAGETRNNAEVLEITLDNNEKIICTPDHKFPIKDIGFIEAKDLKENQSMIPLYKRKSKEGYEEIFNNYNKEWELTHRLVRKHIDLPEYIFNESYKDNPKTITHHKNFKKDVYNRVGLGLIKYRKENKNWHDNYPSPPVWDNQKVIFDQKLLNWFIDIVASNKLYNKEQAVNYIQSNCNNFLNYFFELNKKQDGKISKFVPHFSINYLQKLLIFGNFNGWKNFKDSYNYNNHKIISIKTLNEKINTGTITVNHRFHTFALSCGIFTKNSNLGETSDLEFLRDKIFPALGIPRQYFYDDTFANANTNLSSKSVPFAKKIKRVQRAFLTPCYKIAIIELKLKGISNEKIKQLVLLMNNPSNIDDREKITLETERWNLIAAIKGLNAEKTFFPDYLIYQDFLKMNKDEIAMLMKLNIMQDNGQNPFDIFDIDEKPELAKDLNLQPGAGGGEAGAMGGGMPMGGGEIGGELGGGEGTEIGGGEEVETEIPQEVREKLGPPPTEGGGEKAEAKPETASADIYKKDKKIYADDLKKQVEIKKSKILNKLSSFMEQHKIEIEIERDEDIYREMLLKTKRVSFSEIFLNGQLDGLDKIKKDIVIYDEEYERMDFIKKDIS